MLVTCAVRAACCASALGLALRTAQRAKRARCRPRSEPLIERSDGITWPLYILVLGMTLLAIHVAMAGISLVATASAGFAEEVLGATNALLLSIAVAQARRSRISPSASIPAWLLAVSISESFLMTQPPPPHAGASWLLLRSLQVALLWLLTAATSATRSGPPPAFDPRLPETFDAPHRNPMEDSSFWEVCSFSWVSPVLESGLKKQLEKEHIYDLLESDEVGNSRAALGPVWEEKLRHGYHIGALAIALYRVWWRPFWFAGFLHLMEMLLLFVQPIMLNGLIRYYGDSAAPLSVGVFYTLGLLFGMLASACFSMHFQFCMTRLGIRAQGSISALVFEKALRLTQPAAQQHTPGQIASLMNVDCERLGFAAYFVHFIWSMPLTFALAMAFIWGQLGLASLAAVAVMVGLAPMNKKIAKMFMRISLKISKVRDIRVSTFTEINSAVKFVKLLTWENKIFDLVDAKREKELTQIRGMKNVGILAQFLFVVVPLLLPLLGFGGFFFLSLRTGQPLNPATAFTSLAIFDVLYIPINLVPITAQFLAQMYASIKRIEDLLTAAERQPGGPERAGVTRVLSTPSASAGAESASGYDLNTNEVVPGVGKICLTNVEVRWQPPKDIADGSDNENEDDEPTLVRIARDRLRQRREDRRQQQVPESQPEEPETKLPPTLQVASLEIPAGALTMVVGKVGSGKSTLLSTLLNEVPILKGSIQFFGSTSYCAQQAWIMHGTVRSNILFNRPMDMAWYSHVVKCCALDKDLSSFEKKDMTVVGERGISLSGGQKARLALARAVYSAKDAALLDDVLSAVDAHVGAHLMRHVIKGTSSTPAALCGKTRVLVSHQTQWLPCADFVVVVEGGQIVGAGSYPELLKQGLVEAEADGIVASLGDVGDKEDCDENAQGAAPTWIGEDSSDAQNEDRDEGAVSFKIWKTYAVVLGICTTCIALLSFFLAELCNLLANVVLAAWTAHETQQPPNFKQELNLLALRTAPGSWTLAVTAADLGAMKAEAAAPRSLSAVDLNDASETAAYLGGYAALLLLSGACIMIRSVFMRDASVSASRQLHRGALTAVLRSPMSWHDVTPNGRKINRFTADMQQVDNELQGSSQDVLRSVFQLLGCFGIVIYVSPIVTVFLPFLAVFYYLAQRLYRSSARDLQRLNSIARSPVSQGLDEALAGKSTINGMWEEDNFCKDNVKRLNHLLSCSLVKQAAQRWLAVRLRVLGCAVVAVVGVCALLQHDTNSTRVSSLALALKYGIQLTDVLNSIVQGFIILELALIALERVDTYAQLPSEAPLLIRGAEAALTDYSHAEFGELIFEGVVMRYRSELQPVLKGCNFRIPGGASVGVVGRTGAGKSSLLEAVFRLRELEAGTIRLEGVNIATLGLHQLRSRMAIIPQDPVLFACPLRTNLDPWCEHTDEAIKEQLCRMELRDVLEHPDGLQRAITADGGNLSVGQRQLVCLARALLRRTRVFFLDEATASIDKQTDAVIQRTLRSDAEARTVTLVTIAHRLETVLSSDLIVVMEGGNVAEFGPTAELAATEGGKFKALLKRARIAQLTQPAGFALTAAP